jgi:hypothetical protein
VRRYNAQDQAQFEKPGLVILAPLLVDNFASAPHKTHCGATQSVILR